MSRQFVYSPAGFALTKHFEGLRLTAYQDVGGVWTIGYGHAGPDVHAGLVWTQEQADAALVADVQTAVKAVNDGVTFAINQSQFDALVDFTFNLGRGKLLGSTLLHKLNKGDITGAADQFLLWKYAAGKVVEGLLVRRQAERKLFLGES